MSFRTSSSTNDLLWELPRPAARWVDNASPQHAAAAASHTRFLHVAEQGATVRRAGLRIRVMRQKEVLLEVPTLKLQGIVLHGNIQVSTQCLRLLLEEGVWLSFFTRGGVYKGRLQAAADNAPALRFRQWEQSRDESFCLRFAVSIVRGKLLAQHQIASAYAKNYIGQSLGAGHSTLRESLERIETVTSLEELRGLEGNATRAYFALFRKWNRSAIPFENRHGRGATDPVNQLLNFTYALLTRELAGLLESAGLDPSTGFYHQLAPGRPSLACDWVEEFRHTVADRLVLSLLNRGIIKQSDFEDHGERGGLRLLPPALKQVVSAYEKAMAGPTGYRQVMIRQLAALLDSVDTSAAYRSHCEED